MTRKDAPNSAGLTGPGLYVATVSNPHRGDTTFEEARGTARPKHRGRGAPV